MKRARLTSAALRVAHFLSADPDRAVGLVGLACLVALWFILGSPGGAQ